MKLLKLATLGVGCLILALPAHAQVDQTHRRILVLQTSQAVAASEEQLGGVGYFWFNENDYPWKNSALRVIYAGLFLDTELSVFLSDEQKSAVGVGFDGGAYIDGATPYVNGERLSHQTFYGDHVGLRLFADQELAELPLTDTILVPLHMRGTYRVSGRFFRDAGETKDFVLPDDFLLQTVLADLRLGALRPVLPYHEGAEFYVGLEANYRTGSDAFGPVGSLFPEHSEYQRALTSVAGEVPLGPVRLYARAAGGFGDHIDELSAWKIGGNLIDADVYSFPLHGYYVREILARDFGLVNLELTVPLVDEHALALHFYGDYAVARGVPPQTLDWHNYFGTGAGVSFRTLYAVNIVVSYGYGVNAVRNGDHGGHELGLALQKAF